MLAKSLKATAHSLPGTVLAAFPFLDLWRVLAAACVLALHFQQQQFWPQDVPSFYRLAHLGVIVFFVISGYSVASAAHRAGHQPLEFLVARWSRLYSVVVPALLLALVLDEIAGIGRSDLYPTWQYPKWWLHLGFHLLFLGESWHFTLRPFSIIPYWSLAYEFWYYALLAASMLRSAHWRWLALGVVLLIMGPHLWALLPCWLLGVVVFRVTLASAMNVATAAGPGSLPRWRRAARPLACLGFILAGAGSLASGIDAGLIHWSQQVDEALQAFSHKTLRLDYARWFLADYLIALLFALALLLACQGGPPRNSRLHRGLAWLAPHTFGLYLLHYTLIQFCAALIAPAQRSGWRSPALAALIIATCLLLSVLFSRTRPFWQRGLDGALSRALFWRRGRRAGSRPTA